MAITKLILNGQPYDIGNITNIAMEGAQLYQGRELSDYTWAQLKTMAQNGNFGDLRVGDYKTVQLTNGETIKMQIAGMDTYYKTTDQQLGHHIDWISIDCLNDHVRWNPSNNNNGNATSEYPYMVSYVRDYLINTIYPLLPEEVKNVIVDKRTLLEKRYSASGALTDSTSWGWETMGKLWLPHEYEVFGSTVCGTKQWSAGQAVQYPLFANNWLHRIKSKGNGGGRCHWWLCTVDSGNSTNCCRVTGDGSASNTTASATSIGVPVCFRI